MVKVHIETYGCTLNQADSDIMHAILRTSHEMAPSNAHADVVVINTCTVKGATENKIFERIRKLETGNRKLVIAGCLAANIPKIRKYCPRAPIVTPSSLMHISEAVDDALAGRPMLYSAPESKEGLPRILTAPICRIPINDGCVSSCHFCQTRLARPFLRSYTPKTVVKWMNDAVLGGAREIQLTSQDSGAYGLDIKTNLLTLLDAIANDDSSGRVEGADYLVRLGMINPEHAKRMLPGILDALRGPRFYKFLHVPVQTGSEKVCREMNRDHTVRDFYDIVGAVRGAFPEASIATDIIVGYPTETEEDFEETLELVRRSKPEVVNVSKFSPRPGTAAKGLKEIPNLIVKRRSEVASALTKEITKERRMRYVGRRLRVLVSEKEKDFKGRAVNYHQVVVKGFSGKLGDFVDVDIYDANLGSLFGRAVE
ncbi:tRNA (N(6)-L-threonylcarbamoyladenosine(37)-C(2))-methylthiotransferase [Candidatus Micrarchaeota archaeon]|nr:tRNA (N(6)-L-threonylcarbamoyladenosine(37)-C(2))-methylthiotransferase [Candidatus Micrarchaeota archaeon]